MSIDDAADDTDAGTFTTGRPRGALRRAAILVASLGFAVVASASDDDLTTGSVAARAPVSLDLAQAIELALRNNPEVAASQHDVDAAVAVRSKVAAAGWPTLKNVTGVTEQRREQRLYPVARPGEPAVVSHQVLGSDVVLSVPVYTGGRVSGLRAAAERAAMSAREWSEWTKTDLVFRVTASYYGILAQRRLIEALESSDAALSRHVRDLTALVEERKAAPLDRQRVEVRLAALRQRRIQEENAQRVQTLALLSLIGGDAESSPVRVVGELSRPEVPIEATSAVLVERALARRADYRALAESVRSQEKQVGVARAGYYPQVSLQGSYGLRWGLWPSELPEGSRAIADVGQVGLSVELPIFQGGRVGAEVREQQARLAAMRERLRQAELRIRLDVETALLELRAATERVALGETTVAQATEAFTVETEKQAAGKSTVSEVLSAQSDLLDAEASRARALADANVAVAALQRATGERP